jgi:hypothetical protein
VVAVAVANEAFRVRTPQVKKAVVESPHNVVEDPLNSLLVLLRRLLHEPTDVADGEHQVRPRVGEVGKAPHKALILCGVHILIHTIMTQLQPLLHRSENWVAVSEPC